MFISELGFIAVPAITVICYLLAELFKLRIKKQSYKAIPVFCGVCGALLGAASYIWIPGFVLADNIMVAIAIGIVSGFAATGVNQLVKQKRTK